MTTQTTKSIKYNSIIIKLNKYAKIKFRKWIWDIEKIFMEHKTNHKYHTRNTGHWSTLHTTNANHTIIHRKLHNRSAKSRHTSPISPQKNKRKYWLLGLNWLNFNFRLKYLIRLKLSALLRSQNLKKYRIWIHKTDPTVQDHSAPHTKKKIMNLRLWT